MSLAIYITVFSWRGTRLLDLYQSESFGLPEEQKTNIVEVIVRSWMEMSLDDDEQWVDLVVRALWYADPDKVDNKDDSNDSECGYDGDNSDGSDGERHDGLDFGSNSDEVIEVVSSKDKMVVQDEPMQT